MASLLHRINSAALEDTPHGFFGKRLDGRSHDPVAERRLAAQCVLPTGRVVMTRQIHSPLCVVVRAAWRWQDRPQADGIATNVPGLVLGIVTADCAPVLMADREAGVVAAAHAGWRGAAAGILEHTISCMEELGARRSAVVAVVGPCIAQASYEVDETVRHAVGKAADGFFVAGRAGRFQFDLPGYVADRLMRGGIVRVAQTGIDTYAAPDRFHSYRRACHLDEASDGRQISAIALPPADRRPRATPIEKAVGNGIVNG